MEEEVEVQKNWLEWVVFGVGTLLVRSTLASSSRRGDSRATRRRADVALGTPEQKGAQFIVPVTVGNDGGQTPKASR